MKIVIENLFDPSDSRTIKVENNKRSIARGAKSGVMDLLLSQEGPKLTTVLITQDSILSELIKGKAVRFLMPDDQDFGACPDLKWLYKEYYSGTNVLVGTSGFSIDSVNKYYKYARYMVDDLGKSVLILLRFDPYNNSGLTVPLQCINKSDVCLKAARKVYE